MKIVLLGNPYSTNNIYYRSGARGFMKPEPKKQKEYYIWQAKMQKKAFYAGDIEVSATLYFGDRRTRDIDNYNKLWMDALTGVIYDDDKQIVRLTLEKKYDKVSPRIEIDISEVSPGV